MRHKFEYFGRPLLLHLNPLNVVPPDPVDMDFGEKGLRRFLAYVNETKPGPPFGKYVEGNAIAKNLIQYYVLSLMAVKPSNVLEYSIDYFMKMRPDRDYLY